jgi:GntR family transcriptional regulator, transcriptional repressor for pyruvate dehydrogenase complex
VSATAPPVIGLIEETGRTSDTASRAIRSLIWTGELGPGDRLPPERVLATQLGISRTALREALKLLEASGYIVTKVGAKGGTRVVDTASLERCYDGWLKTQRERLGSLFELQHVLERALAAFAAERRTAEDLQRLEATRIPAAMTRSEAYRCHTLFHEALGVCAHNPELAGASKSLRREIFLPIDFLMDMRLMGEFREFHESIFAAVRDQDAERALLEMDAHLQDLRSFESR